MQTQKDSFSKVESYWAAEVEKYQTSGLTGAEFCRRSGHKYSEFMNWKERLRKALRQGKTSKTADSRDWAAIVAAARAYPSGVFNYCHDHGISRSDYYKHTARLRWAQRKSREMDYSDDFELQYGDEASSKQNFVPVRVMEESPRASESKDRSYIEIVLPSSIIIRIDATCPLEFLSTLVSALGER